MWLAFFQGYFEDLPGGIAVCKNFLYLEMKLFTQKMALCVAQVLSTLFWNTFPEGSAFCKNFLYLEIKSFTQRMTLCVAHVVFQGESAVHEKFLFREMKPYT